MKKFKELFFESLDLDERVITTHGMKRRLQQRRFMRALARRPDFQRKKRRTLMRMRDAAKLQKSAKKQTINKFRKKVC